MTPKAPIEGKRKIKRRLGFLGPLTLLFPGLGLLKSHCCSYFWKEPEKWIERIEKKEKPEELARYQLESNSVNNGMRSVLPSRGEVMAPLKT